MKTEFLIIALLGINVWASAVVYSQTTERAYEETVVTDGGTISGVVRLTGSPPKIRQIRTTRDHDYCGETILSQKYIISPAREIQNVVVSIEQVTKGKKIIQEEIVIVHQGCLLVPRIQATTIGNRLTIVNNDTILHNAHAYFNEKTLFNFALPTGGMTISRPLKKEPGTVEVRCDLHEWTRGWIVVEEHPYFAVTDSRGTFKITDVPPGIYRLSTWHEAFGTMTKEVTVTTGGDTKVSFELRR